ncbi:tetratricopeptide repeat protein [Calditrichota bacterium LG25]
MESGIQLKPSVSERQRLLILYERYRHDYETNLNRLYRQVRKLLIKTDINFNIKYRLKSFDSYFQKLIRYRQKEVNPIIINDLIGMRIICPFLEDIEYVESIIRSHFKVIEIEHKSAGKPINEFSYESIHLTIELPEDQFNGFIPYSGRTCELQLRTILQDAWAEVEHELIYKANFTMLNEPIKRKLASLNATLTLSDIIFQEIRDYQKAIKTLREKCDYTMTQKILLPNGSVIPGNGHNAYEEIDLPAAIISKSSVEKQLFEALEAHSKQQFPKAIQIYSQLLRQKLKPAIRSIVYNHRGMAYFVLGEYEKAIKDFTQAYKFDSQNLRALNNRGLAYRMLKKYDLALKDFGHSLEIDAYQHEGYHMRALTYFDLQDFPKALADCNKALNLKPDYSPAQSLKNLIVSKMSF